MESVRGTINCVNDDKPIRKSSVEDAKARGSLAKCAQLVVPLPAALQALDGSQLILRRIVQERPRRLADILHAGVVHATRGADDSFDRRRPDVPLPN